MNPSALVSLSARLFAISIAFIATMTLSACGPPTYPEWETSIDERPGVVYLFSAADATRSSPIFMSVKGRELNADDDAVHMRLIRHWVAAHTPEGTTFGGWASAECGLKRKDEFPGCHIFIADNSATGKQMELYFYGGNWGRK